MNKIYSIFTMLLLSVTALTLGSCTEEYEYSGAKAEGEQVYFSNALPSTVELSSTESNITVPVNRINRQGELTVPLTVSVPDGSSLTVSNQVTFNDGDSVAYITINYDPTTIEYGHYDEITVAIQDANYTTPYGSSSYTFNAGLTEWKPMNGTASFRDGLFPSMYSINTLTYDVEIEENVLTPGMYRLVNPYGATTDWGKEYINDDYFTASSGDHYIVINATDPNFVYIDGAFEPGAYYDTAEDGPMLWYSLVTANMELGGWPLDQLKSQHPELFGKLENGVFTFPVNSLFCEYGTAMTGSGFYLNTEGTFAVALPGSSIRDYSASFAYSGRFTDANDTDHALGTITLGEDVASARYAIAMDGDDLNVTAHGIIDGSIPYETITASGSIEMNLTENGIYYMVIVTYDANGNSQETSAYQFVYRLSSKPENWQVATTGTFYYNFYPYFIPSEDGGYEGGFYDAKKENVTLYVDDNFPAFYKIVPFGENSELPFMMDAYGNISYIDVNTGSKTTVQGQSYDVYVGDYGIFSDAGQTASFYDVTGSLFDVPGLFVFGNIYYCERGYFGAAYEVFMPSSSVQSFAPKKASLPFKVAAQKSANKSLKPLLGMSLKKNLKIKKSIEAVKLLK